MGRKPRFDWDKAEFGKKTDKEIAQELGCTATSVRANRLKRGIARVPRWRAVNATDWSKQPLGLIPDTELARKLGISPTTVNGARWARGIPAFNGRCVTTEGEPATHSEALIDLWLHENGIAHKFQVNVGKYRADWVVGSEVWEFAGVLEWHDKKITERYDNKLRLKKVAYASEGFSLKVITPEALKSYLPKGQVHPAATALQPRKCVVCGNTVSPRLTTRKGFRVPYWRNPPENTTCGAICAGTRAAAVRWKGLTIKK